MILCHIGMITAGDPRCLAAPLPGARYAAF